MTVGWWIFKKDMWFQLVCFYNHRDAVDFYKKILDKTHKDTYCEYCGKLETFSKFTLDYNCPNFLDEQHTKDKYETKHK
jgi:hypothetical protein